SAYGTGNLNNWGTNSPQQPTPLFGSIPPASNLLMKVSSGDNPTLTGTINGISFAVTGTPGVDGGKGTITFSSLFNYSNVFVGIKDGNGTPTWAIFSVGAVLASTVLKYDYLNCQQASCPIGSSIASGLLVWGSTSP